MIFTWLLPPSLRILEYATSDNAKANIIYCEGRSFELGPTLAGAGAVTTLPRPWPIVVAETKNN
ncbi:hypothetical protein A9K55_003999 [Cordyceps militaris]|uniref:Uncharacterized protein n=1 Tax=Cordyceps militaris TaxID=73501 RepID=A0A2H4SPS3_CORMI|nr:hypothetical protein A9K55_003999 [Cordyceps militaris]